MNYFYILAIVFCASIFQIKAQPNCSVSTTGFTPINDLGAGTFNGWTGGLYPNSSNAMPAAHKAAGQGMAAQITPRDVNGNATSTGKIVWLSIGMSNTTSEYQQFITVMNGFSNKNSKLVLVDGAQGGMSSDKISTVNNPSYATFWNTVSTRLSNAGVTSKQVQVIWLKEALPAGGMAVQTYYDTVLVQYKRIVNEIKQRFPNAAICYMGSRISARYASSTLNPEPYAYWQGWVVKKVIEDQINGDAQLQYSGANAKAPWLCWGMYLWSDGVTPQTTNTNVFWDCSTDFQADGTHPSVPTGALKVANLMFNYFKADTFTCPWMYEVQPALCASSTAVNENDVKNIHVSLTPSPFSGQLQLQSNVSLVNASLILYDVLGKKQVELTGINGNTYTLSSDKLQTGIYLYQLFTTNASILSVGKFWVVN